MHVTAPTGEMATPAMTIAAARRSMGLVLESARARAWARTM
jgi:hypothetical protein